MRIAHIILTYTDPLQTERMIKAMWHKDFDFYVHVDKKFDITPHMVLGKIPNVYFIKNRIDVKWAGFSTIEAEFASIREVMGTYREYGFLNLMSGQDYPMARPQDILDFFSKNAGKEFLNFYDYKNEWPEGMRRIEQYCFSDVQFKGKFRLEQLLSFVLPKRKVPYNYQPYGKSMFWTLSPAAALYVVNAIEKDAKLKRFFAWSWASDEFLFPTMLMNSFYRERIVNNNYRYIDWSEGNASPKTLKLEDFKAIMKSDNLFIRKVDAKVSGKLLDHIDEVIKHKAPKNASKIK